MQFGNAVCFTTPQGYYLSFASTGEVKFDINSNYEQYNSSIAKLTKWIIVDAKNPKSNNVVTPFDDIILRSAFG